MSNLYPVVAFKEVFTLMFHVANLLNDSYLIISSLGSPRCVTQDSFHHLQKCVRRTLQKNVLMVY